MTFPTQRPRRLRRGERLRSMVRETRLTPDRLIYPLFIAPGQGLRREISSLPGCFHLSADEAAKEAREVEALGIARRDPVRPARGQGPRGHARVRGERRRASRPCARSAPPAATCS